MPFINALTNTLIRALTNTLIRLLVDKLNNDAKKFSPEQSSSTPVQYCPKVKQEVPKDPDHLTMTDPEKYSGPMRQHNAKLISEAKQLFPKDGPTSVDLNNFLKYYETNKARYEAVAKKTDFPPDLIAALHWRESNGGFDRMMSNGSLLDKKSSIKPYDGPYNSWEDSAVAVLKDSSRQSLQKTLELDKNPNDLVGLVTFAEAYNGTGYFDRGIPSPYVFSGSDVYSKGKYIEVPNTLVSAKSGSFPSSKAIGREC